MDQQKTEELERLQTQIDNLNFDDLADSKKKTKPNSEPALPAAKEPPPSQCSSNLERFHFICKDLPSPDIFITLNFYFQIAACLNRKIWFGGNDGHFLLYPNLYIIFVSDPGIGKSLPAGASNRILDSLVETRLNKDQKLERIKLLNLGPDAITFEKLVLRAAEATETIKLEDKKFYHHSSTTFCLGDELGMLFCDNTKRVISFLMKAYDCGKFEGDAIKHGEKIINNICVNFLGCTTPEIMRDLLKTKVLDSGFIGRTLFIFADKKRPHPSTIHETEEQRIETEYLKKHLRKLCKVKPQQIKMSIAATNWLDIWHYEKQKDILNPHPRLKDYYARKKAQLIKLAIAHSYADKVYENDAEKTPVRIEVEDFIAVNKVLLDIEPQMHRALIYEQANPLSILGDKVLEYLRINGPVQKRKLYVNLWSDGDTDQIDKVLNYLKEVGQIKSENINGKDGVKLI